MKIKPPSTAYKKLQPLVRRGKKIGRNDKCPCDSGKKYKQCCLPKELEAQRPKEITVTHGDIIKKKLKRTKFK